MYLNARGYVVDNPNGFAVRVPRKWMRNDMVFHLARWLVSCFNTIDSLAGWALQASIFVAIIIHGHQALQVVLMSTLREASNWLRPRNATDTWAFIARRTAKRLHTYGTILKIKRKNLSTTMQWESSFYQMNFIYLSVIRKWKYIYLPPLVGCGPSGDIF